MKVKTLILMTLTALTLLIGARCPESARADSFAAPKTAEEKRSLFRRGAQLWPVYCNTCHNARPSTEFAPTEWNMIIMHMRTQANLTGEDARAVLEYLKSSR